MHEGSPSLPYCRNYKELRLWLTIYGGACQRTEEIKYNSRNTTVPWLGEILLLLLSSIDYDSIPMRFLCELSTKNYCVQLLEGCTCGHLVYLPTNIICLVIYGNLLGSGSQSGSIWGCKCISIKNFTEKAKVNCPTTTTKAVKREKERKRERGAFSRSFIMLKVCIGACANNFTVE